MRVGVVGLGSIGRRHIGNVFGLGADVVALDVDGAQIERAKAEYPMLRLAGVRFIEQLDAVVIATPWDKHLEWAEWAIEHRLPMFIEKPLGSIEQLPRWREIAAMDLPVNQVGYMLRWQREARLLKSLNPLGGELWLRWNAAKYGHRLEESSHEIDLALWMGADAAALDVVERDDLRFGPWRVRINDRSDRYWRQWEATSASGRMSQVSRACFRSPDELGDEMYRDEMAHFLDCVREGKQTDCPLADGLRVLEVCAQIEAA